MRVCCVRYKQTSKTQQQSVCARSPDTVLVVIVSNQLIHSLFRVDDQADEFAQDMTAKRALTYTIHAEEEENKKTHFDDKTKCLANRHNN